VAARVHSLLQTADRVVACLPAFLARASVCLHLTSQPCFVRRCVLSPGAAELQAAQEALAAKGQEMEAASAELDIVRAQLTEATAAMQDAHEQLAELQVGHSSWLVGPA